MSSVKVRFEGERTSRGVAATAEEGEDGAVPEAATTPMPALASTGVAEEAGVGGPRHFKDCFLIAHKIANVIS